MMGIKMLVPKKGLEPPHPCEYVDLNHARLPIPPLRHFDNDEDERQARQSEGITLRYYSNKLRDCCQTRGPEIIWLLKQLSRPKLSSNSN
jgi:hypothetical protein